MTLNRAEWGGRFLLLLLLAGAVPCTAGAIAEPPRDVVLSADELPRDETGSSLSDGLPGVLPRRPVPETLPDGYRALERERERLLAPADVLLAPDVIPPLPGDEHDPPRMDTGDPDPDRLAPDAQPVELRTVR